MVTHDRYFLERVCNEIIELDNGQLYTYKGNYSDYLEKRNARIVQDDVEAHKTKQTFKKELEWMRRQPKARTTKSKSRIEDFKQIKAKAHPKKTRTRLQLGNQYGAPWQKIIELHTLRRKRQTT